jgi:hypothetical protein
MMQDLAWTVSEMEKYMAFSVMTRWVNEDFSRTLRCLIELHLDLQFFPLDGALSAWDLPLISGTM